MKKDALEAIAASAEGRERTFGMRLAMVLFLHGPSVALVTGAFAVVGMIVAVLAVCMWLDLHFARRAIASPPERKPLAIAVLLCSSLVCTGVFAALSIFAALYGGELGLGCAALGATASLLNGVAFMHTSRLYMGVIALPAVVTLLSLPFLPHLGPVRETPLAWLGSMLSVAAVLFYLRRTAQKNDRSLSQYRSAMNEAREGHEDAERRRIEAEKASRAKSELLANMSHELRTPLNAVIGYSEILEEELRALGEDACMHDAVRIRVAGLRLLNLIEDLLDLSKIDAGRMEVTVERFDVSALVCGVAMDARGAADERGAKLEVDVAPELGFACTDAGKVRLALAGLLSNAVKFADGGLITLRAARETLGGDEFLRFSVTDNGRGIAQQHLAVLFEPFSQADSSLMARAEGTGLGLSKSRRMMQMLGGDLVARSTLGAGSCFTIRIPAFFEPAARSDTEEKIPEGAPVVLIIEDDPTARDLARRAAQRAGLRAVCADNAAEGLYHVRKDRPALVLLDIELPDRSGWEILSMLKQDANTRATPVVVVSVNDDRARAQRLGADDHLVKPVGREHLAAAMRKHALSAGAVAA